MKGKLHHDPPPDFITTGHAAEALGMSRANFHAKYAQSLDRWLIGPGNGTLLFRKEDVADMARWRTVRRGMIALGIWPINTPGVPTVGGFHTAVHEEYWDADCPRCGGEGVGDPLDDRVWCPECGKQNIDDPQATEEDWDEAYEKYYAPEEKEENGYF